MDGTALMDLTEGDEKSMMKLLGHVKRMLQLVKAKVNSEVSLICMYCKFALILSCRQKPLMLVFTQL